MSGDTTRKNGKPRRVDERPIQDELVCLKQAVNILRLAEQLSRSGDLDDDPDQLAAVIKSGRVLVEEVAEAFTAHLAAQGGAS